MYARQIAPSQPPRPSLDKSSVIGKTIAGIITRPGEDGQVVMLQFEDGTCFELVSVRAQRALLRMAKPVDERQLSFFVSDGAPPADEIRPSLAA